MQKKNIMLIFGGRSGEHKVSLKSAAAVMAVMDRVKYNIIPVGISPQGEWWAGEEVMPAFQRGEQAGSRVILLPESSAGALLYLRNEQIIKRVKITAVFPLLHGPFGEDGTIQGLLELSGLPYVGAGVLGSAVGMDKVMMKMLLQNSGLPVGKYLFFTSAEFDDNPAYWVQKIATELEFPCFVKPANLGSSVGITKAKNREDLLFAVREAARYDLKILVEKTLYGKEIECSVLGNYQPRASVPGEIVPCNEFYDYRAKYVDDRSELIIPAPLSATLTEQVKSLAIKAFRVLECFGLARMDFFVNTTTEEVIINEINTIPGFTSISMYPKLWEASGLNYSDLIDELINLALKRHAARAKLLTVYAD